MEKKIKFVLNTNRQKVLTVWKSLCLKEIYKKTSCIEIDKISEMQIDKMSNLDFLSICIQDE